MKDQIKNAKQGQLVWRVTEYNKGKIKYWAWRETIRATYEDKEKALKNSPDLIEIEEGKVMLNGSSMSVKFQYCLKV